MLNDKDRAEFDQGKATLVEIYPPLWWGLYEANMKLGFTPDQSLDLIKTYMMSSMGGSKAS